MLYTLFIAGGLALVTQIYCCCTTLAVASRWTPD